MGLFFSKFLISDRSVSLFGISPPTANPNLDLMSQGYKILIFMKNHQDHTTRCVHWNHGKAHQGAAFATPAGALSLRAWVEIWNKPESPPANHPRFFNSSSVFDPGPKGPDKADGKKYNRALKMQAPKKRNENVWYPQFGIFEAKLHRFLRFIVRIYSLICAQSKSDLIL